MRNCYWSVFENVNAWIIRSFSLSLSGLPFSSFSFLLFSFSIQNYFLKFIFLLKLQMSHWSFMKHWIITRCLLFFPPFSFFFHLLLSLLPFPFYISPFALLSFIFPSSCLSISPHYPKIHIISIYISIFFSDHKMNHRSFMNHQMNTRFGSSALPSPSTPGSPSHQSAGVISRNLSVPVPPYRRLRLRDKLRDIRRRLRQSYRVTLKKIEGMHGWQDW